MCRLYGYSMHEKLFINTINVTELLKPIAHSTPVAVNYARDVTNLLCKEIATVPLTPVAINYAVDVSNL